MHILLADDHGLFRDALSAWLKALNGPVRVSTGTCFAHVAQALDDGGDRPELILLDLAMPGMDGVQGVRRVCALARKIPVIVVSADENPHAIDYCLNAGAAGYVPKSASGDTILTAVRQVLAGEIWRPRITASAMAAGSLQFTERERSLMAELAEGRSNREIADRLCLSEGTVKQYVSILLSKLGADNRTQAGMQARAILGLG